MVGGGQVVNLLKMFGGMEIVKKGPRNVRAMVSLGYPTGYCRFTCSLEWKWVHPGTVAWATILVKCLSWFQFTQGHLENEAAAVISLSDSSWD